MLCFNRLTYNCFKTVSHVGFEPIVQNNVFMKIAHEMSLMSHDWQGLPILSVIIIILYQKYYPLPIFFSIHGTF